MGYTLKLISEHIEQDTDYLIEQDEKTGNKNYKIKGIFMQVIRISKIVMVEYILWKFFTKKLKDITNSI